MAVEAKTPQPKTPSRPEPATRPVASLHLWQITPVRDMFWIGLGVTVLLFTYWLRSIFTPVLIGLLLAYIFNPLISRLEQRWRVPRPAVISILLIPLTLGLIFLLVWVAPALIWQTFSLLGQVPKFISYLIGILEREGFVAPGELAGVRGLVVLPQHGTPQDVTQAIFGWTSQAFGYIGTVIETTTYVILTLILIPIYFFSFAWQFDSIVQRAKEIIPPRHRDRTLHIFSQMDAAVSGFFRGRLIVAFVMSAVFMLGWYLADVPYWFLLGILAGILNIVPYLVTLVWPLAVLLKWLAYVNVATPPPDFHGPATEAASTMVAVEAPGTQFADAIAATQAAVSQPVGELAAGYAASAIDTAHAAALQAVAASQAAVEHAAGAIAATLPAASLPAAATQPIDMGWVWVIAAPTIAYLAAQFLDNWFITPIIQSRSSNLSAVTIIIVVLVGGAVGGLYGLLLAIPIAACLKILMKEVMLPHLQKWAQEA